MTVKRRLIWMTDEQWAEIQRWADSQGLTTSAYIRAATLALVDRHPAPDAIDHAIRTVERMETLGRGTIVEDGGFNTRPFTPVPKGK